MRALLAAGLALTALMIAAATAGACSCAAEDPETRLSRADAAFVGTVTASRPGRPAGPSTADGTTIYSFAVERVYKGEIRSTVEVEIARDGGTCGFVPEHGERLGLLLFGSAPWSAGICHRISPEDLERTSAGSPPPSGSGRAALLLTGSFEGGASVLALDAAGRPLLYGRGRGGQAVSVCPGSQRVVQAGSEMVVRRLPDLKVVARRALAEPAAYAVRCIERFARDVVVARAISDIDRSSAPGIGRVRGGREALVAGGSQPYAALGRRFALAIAGEEGNVRLRRVSYRSGRARTLARFPELPTYLSLSPDEQHAAFVGEGRLVLIDVVSRRVRSARVDASGPIVWLDSSRLLLAGAERARIFDTRGVEVASMARWSFGRFAVVGEVLWTVGDGGVLQRSRPVSEPPARVTLLPGDAASFGDLVAVPGRPRVRASAAGSNCGTKG